MKKNRLESFSDGVLAIIITIMVLNLGVPYGDELSALYPLIPVFLAYILSFINVGIYWIIHHQLINTIPAVTGKILLMNLMLLFWISLMPFTTAWMAENFFTSGPTMLYGIVILMVTLSIYLLELEIIEMGLNDSLLKKVIGRNKKEKTTIIFYIIAIFSALIHPQISQLLYLGIGLNWILSGMPKILKKS